MNNKILKEMNETDLDLINGGAAAEQDKNNDESNLIAMNIGSGTIPLGNLAANTVYEIKKDLYDRFK